MTLEALAQQGRRYVSASLAASVALRTNDLRKELFRESLAGFQHADHRLEPVANIHGIEFINDSKACSIHSSWWALESMRKPVVWIAGGFDRMLDYTQLRALVSRKVKAIIFIGDDDKKIQKAFDKTDIPVVSAADVQEAVALAYYMGKKGDAVLLSPGCPPGDRFEDAEERGMQFRQAVKNL